MDAREKKTPLCGGRFPLDTIAKPRTKQTAILLSHATTQVAEDEEEIKEREIKNRSLYPKIGHASFNPRGSEKRCHRPVHLRSLGGLTHMRHFQSEFAGDDRCGDLCIIAKGSLLRYGTMRADTLPISIAQGV